MSLEPRALRALFVTARWDAPYRYRCAQACEQLRSEGAVANVLHIQDPRLPGAVDQYGVVILFRLPWDAAVEALVDRARRIGVPIVFDIDDLVFDPAIHDVLPFRSRYSAEAWSELYGKPAMDLRRTLEVADLFIGSTPALAEQATRLGKPAVVHPNVVPDLYLRQGARMVRLRSALRPFPTIGYFAGSNTHDEDLATISGALARVLDERPRARLLLAGFVDLDSELVPYAPRVVRLPYMSWRDYGRAFAACHVNVAPQSGRTAFTDAKSALKFFEAGAFFTPTVATPVRDMVRAIDHGQTGLLADTEDEWVACLHRALDVRHSELLGTGARAATEQSESAASVRGRLAAILREIAAPSTGPPPKPSPLYPPESPALAAPVAALGRPIELVGDLAALVRAIRTPPGSVPDVGRFDRWIARVRGDVAARRFAEQRGAILLAVDSTEALRSGAQIGGAGELPGEVETLGPDPWWMSERFDASGAGLRYLVVRMRAAAPGRIGRAQCYFKIEGRPLSEARSLTFSVRLDGADQTVVVDLLQGQQALGRSDLGRLERIRFDPLDRAASVRLSLLALVPEDALSVEGEPEHPATLDLGDASPEATTAMLTAALSSLEVGGVLRVTCSRPAAELRQLLRTVRGPLFHVLELASGAPGSSAATLAHMRRGYRGLDVIVPVYGAPEQTMRCLDSVVAHRSRNVRLVVIDDKSPDPRVLPALRAFAGRHANVEVLANAENLGFVQTCNLGMSHAGERDVLLLNSDTEVFEGFSDDLVAAAYSRDAVGVVCPLSNNATICSVPEFCLPNDVPQGLSRAEMARLVRQTSLSRHPELVTAHGFCMYIRRDCLDEVGPFDPDRYGAGFGEENDLAERVKQSGRSVILADEVYVWHDGSASFGDRAHALSKEHASVLEGQHPGYHAAVARFIAENPLAPIHENLAVHLARGSLREQPAVLHLLHANPFADDAGGVEHCVLDLVRALEAERVVVVYPSGAGIEVAEVLGGAVDRAERYVFPLSRPVPRFAHEHPEAVETLREILDVFQIGVAHVHHLMYWPLGAGRLLSEARVPFVVTVHDFYWACPSFNLLRVDRTEPCCPGSCGDADRTRACMRALFGALAEPVDVDPNAFVDAHRLATRQILSSAQRVVFPSHSTRALVGSVLGMTGDHFEVRPHGYALGSARPSAHGGALRIAVVGNTAYASKGAEAVLETVRRSRDLDVEWHFFGRIDLFGFEERLRSVEGASIVAHGPYERQTIVDTLVRAGMDVGLLMPAWPETFSYTLSELAAAGVVIIARRIGALADRIEAGLPGILVADPDEAADALRSLTRDARELERRREAIFSWKHPSTAPWAEQFAEDYQRCLALAPPRESGLSDRERIRRLTAARRPSSSREPRRVQVTEPGARHRSAWWYPHAERLKRYAPEGIRHLVRRALSDDGLATVQRFRLPSRRALIMSGLSLDRVYLGTARLVVHDDDPYLSIQVRPFAPSTVDAVRFNLWCGATATAHAQVYWMHKGDDGFSEKKSVTVPLDSRSGLWQEYVVQLRGSPEEAAWLSKDEDIVALRFDPIDVPGSICLGELALCKRRQP